VLSVSENGCTSILDTQAVNVLLSPTSTFTKNNPHCAGDTLVLNYTGNAAAVVGANALWNIPSGATLVNGSLNSFSPIKVILPTGMNHFGMTITNSICTSTSNDSIRIYKIPTSTFTINPTTNCTALASTLTYTGNASNAATYNWNFASGTATPGGTTKNQSVIWNAAGNYNVVLSVSENGCTSILDTQAVNVLLSPTSTFTKNNPNCAGDTLVLNYTGNAAAVVGATALWNIPTGATLVNGSLNSFSPIKVILPTGMNHIGLTITNSICTSTSNDSIRIYKIPTSTFTINPTTNCTALASTLTYTGNASNAATYNWNFASGTATPGGTTKNQSVIWNAAGNYNVVLSVSENGCTSILDTQAVNVLLSPTSTFTKNNPHCAGDTLTLTYTGNGTTITGASALWSFTNNPTIVSGSVNSFGKIKLITKSGKTVILMKVTNGSCITTLRDSVIITAIPTNSFQLSSVSPCVNAAIILTYNGNAPSNATYNWGFNGGNATPGGTVKGPQSVLWTTAGTKTVSLQVVNNGCSSAAGSAIINVVPIATTSFTISPLQICSGSTAAITYTGSNTATAYTWAATGTHIPASILGKGPHNVKWTNNTNANSKEMVILKVMQNGCLSLPDTNYITVVPIPVAAFTTNSPICPIDTIRVHFSGSNNTIAANYYWNFSGNSYINGNGIGPYKLQYPASGNYVASLFMEQNNCVSDTFIDTIKILPQPIVVIKNDTTICMGSAITLTATGASSYVWDNNLGSSASIFVHPTTTTTYKVVGTNGSCSGSDEATVKVSSYPMAYAGRDTMIPINSYIDLGTAATVGYHYSWNNAASLSNSYISNPIATPSDSTMYIVTVSNNDGCATTDTVIILVGRCYHLAIANTFTPNGDGENDNFRILNPRQLLSLEKFDIYNRWGEKVFSANDIHNAAWDGTYKGVMQEIGTYVYIIQATCLTNEPINLKGSVELVR
jgi:gliding motility-associated-like protein